MRINTNVSAMNTHRQYGINNAALAKSTEKLSSGYRINSAADDAAGLAISEKMRAQIRGMNQSSLNVQDGISLVQTAEGYLQTATDILQRLNELANQAANGTLSSEDIQYIDEEVSQLFEELEKTLTDAKFNGHNLFAENYSIQIQAGANSDDILTMSWEVDYTTLEDYELLDDQGNNVQVLTTTNGAEDVTIGLFKEGFTVKDANGDIVYDDTQAYANAAIDAFQNALDYVNSIRARLGGYENRLEYRQGTLDIAAENLSAAESRIRDVDMAKEMTEYTKQNILSQAATAMLAQANSQPQLVLQLLG